ncbi:hypothetical protein [Paenibacillus etheri]|uniref:Uncharacterized protein n=1 Tax=Paenibacillus etheri TaxID=1306852 RepID=A0A0W1B3R3_9BACL|nr:hypothetical protein [Paenibacillus etheri]KTD88191.1 hypothetical protein UQ64_06790 [Paenibacillus etheri]
MATIYTSGNAKASQVLAGTKFSAGPTYGGFGTMKNMGDQEILASAAYMQEGYLSVSIPQLGVGESLAVNGGTEFTYVDAVHVSAKNILMGVEMLGLEGTATSDATATAADILSNKVAYSKGQKTVGTIPVITSGEDPAQGVGLWPDGSLAVYPREGYRKGGAGAGEIRVSTTQLNSVGLVKLSTGSLTPSGSAFSQYLGFRPRVIIVEYANNGTYRAVYVSNGHLGDNRFSYYGVTNAYFNSVVWTITDTGFTLTVTGASGMGNAQFWAFS